MQTIIQMVLFLGLSATRVSTPLLEAKLETPVVAPSERLVVHNPKDEYQAEDEPYVLTWYEYVHTYEGLCPHEQPEHPFKHDWQWLTAIGSKYDNGKTPEGFLQQAWGWWRNGEITGLYHAITYNNDKFTIDYDTLSVVGDSYLTGVLQDFEERYKAKCPNN